MPKCYRCGKMLCTMQALEYHLNKKVKCSKPHTCEFCDKEFDSKLELLYHRRECKLDFSRIAAILKPNKETAVYITDRSFNILFTDDHKCLDSNYTNRLEERSKIQAREKLIKGACKTLCKLKTSEPVYISCLPQANNNYIIFERPYVHPLSRPGFMTPQ